LVTHVGLAGAAEKPDEIVIGITTFSSGPASVFGEPANAAAEMLIEDLNEHGGIGGVPVRTIFIDEGAGSEHVVSEYRRVVQDEGADVMLAAISSGNCNQVVPLAEDLKVLNIMWDCGTQRIFEEGDYRYAFRTQANATPEMVATALYLLKTKPDFRTIAVINQDYAWGRDSWDIFSKTLKALKPDVEIVAELFPKFGAPDYSTEITRLSALRPDVVLSTSWGGDLDTLVRQAAQRGLFEQSTFVLPLAESSLQRLGKDLPEGVIVGGRGDHYFLHPEYKDDPEFQAFMQAFRDKTGAWPIYPVFHMAQALRALQAAYEKALEAGNGEWPDTEALVDALEGLEFRGLSRPVKIREDHQGLEDQMLGTTIHVDEYDFAVLDNMMIFPAKEITTPVGKISGEWVQSLSPELINLKVDTYQYGS
jgi:branched-chain amino acid transport system substrate-binding protein